MLFSFRHALNRFRAVDSHVKGRTVTTGMPSEILLEITSYCNLACPMCGRGSKTTPNAFMSLDLFKSIIDQVKSYAELVAISGGVGEPLAHPHIGEMIGYCKAANLRCMVSTNATLLNAKKTNALLDNGLDILILSLDGATKETHEAIRVGSNFEQTMANVDNFLKEKVVRKLKFPITICQMIYAPSNKDEAKQFHDRWAGTPGVNSVRIKKLLTIKGSLWSKLQKLTQMDPDAEKSCFYPWRQLAVSANGAIALCCRDHNFSYPLANLSESSVSEIWNSQVFQDARLRLANKRKSEIELCVNCETFQTSFFSRMGIRMLDTYTIHTIAPAMERVASKLGLRLW